MDRSQNTEVDLSELNSSVVRMRDEMDLVRDFSLHVSDGMQASTKLLFAMQEMVSVIEHRLGVIEKQLGIMDSESLDAVAKRALGGE